MADEEKAPKGGKQAKAKGGKSAAKQDYGPDFKYIVRLSNTDIDGAKSVRIGLTGVKGIGDRVALVLTRQVGVDARMLMGNLTDAHVEQIQKALDSVAETMPSWAVNRPYDVESGQDLHMVGSDIDMTLRDDLNRLKKIRSYRGIRHENNLPVRGQRTRSNGRTGLTIGVARSKEARQAQATAAKGTS